MALVLCRHWLSWGIRPVVVVLHAEPADLAPDFAALAVDCVTLDIPRTGRARYFVLAARVFALARRYRAIGLLSMPFGWHTFIALGARLGGVRRVVAHVGNYPNIANRIAFAKFKILVQLGRPLTDRLVCCSRYVQQGAMKHFGVRESETAVVYNGVPVEAFASSAVRRPSDPAKPFTIGMAARLEKHKDQKTLIRAAKILKDRGRNVRVQIVGEGSERRALEQIIETENIADIVSLLGVCRDVPAIIAGLDLFAFSTTPDEGFGIALAEAMIGRVPIVASDVGACREVLDDGSLGLLVPPADPVALADAIDAVRADPQAANIRAIRAREKAMREFSGQAMARAYGEFLGASPIERSAASALIRQTV